jgi:adenine phosphoribosyltransferase
MTSTLGSRCFTVKRDHPKPGVTFYDMAPLLADPALRRRVIAQLGERTRGLGVTHILAIETRGFWVGSWIAEQLGVAVIALRKKSNALKAHAEADLVGIGYGLEYSEDASMALPRGCIPKGARVLLVDDVFATGGTLIAAAVLCRSVQADCEVVGTAVLLEIMACNGRTNFLKRTGLAMDHVTLFAVPVHGGSICDEFFLAEIPDALNIAVCSLSKLKLGAVQDALVSLGKVPGDDCPIRALNAPSDNVAQPIGNKEIYACMINRLVSSTSRPAVNARDFETHISMESGIVRERDGSGMWREVTCIGLFKRASPTHRFSRAQVSTKWVAGPVLDPESPEYKDVLAKVFAAKGAVTVGALLHERDPSVPADAWYNRRELIASALKEMLA